MHEEVYFHYMNTADKQKAVISAVVLGLIILGLAVWYMATTPPKPLPVGQVPEEQVPEGAFRKEVTTDEGPYHTAIAAYPAETPLKSSAGVEADARAVSLLSSFVTGQIADFKARAGFETMTAEDIQMLGFDQGRKYALELDFEVSEGPKTISYVYTIYEDTLGAHPNGYYRTFTFDKATGAELMLGDILTGNYLARLSELSRAKLPAIIAEKSGAEANIEYIESGTTATPENFQNFAIQADTLVLIFPPYQVGPYALGTQFVEIPLSEIADMVQPVYR